MTLRQDKHALDKRVASLKSAGLSYAEIGDRLGISKDAAQKRGKRVLFTFSEDAQPVVLPEPMSVEGDVVLAADIHVPDTSQYLIRALIGVARATGIRKLAVVGDMFSMDFLSRFPPAHRGAEWKREKAAAKELMAALSEVFDAIYWCRGNHEQRLIGATDAELDMADLRDMVMPEDSPTRVFVSPYNFIHLKSGGQPWLLAHQFRYNRRKLVVAEDLSVMHQVNVVQAHQHHAGVGISKDGRWTVADLPCMCNDPAYAALNVSDIPRMVRGFGYIQNGRITLVVDNGLFGPNPEEFIYAA